MAFTGTLRRVADKDKGWGLCIDTDEKGDTWFTLFDKKYAGVDSKEHPAICDIHDMIGERVCFEAKRGNLKDKGGPEDGERFNSTITAIGLEVGGPEKSVREMAKEMEYGVEVKRKVSELASSHETEQEHVEDKYDRLRTSTMDMMNSIGKWAAEVERLFKES